MKVMLMDDSPIMRMMLKGLLGQVGIQDIVEAVNGLEGLHLLSKHTFELIFMDIHMPEMDGIGFLEYVQKRPEWSQIPVVVISSDSEAALIDKAEKLGAKAYVTKPFRIEGLKAALAKALPGKAVG